MTDSKWREATRIKKEKACYDGSGCEYGKSDACTLCTLGVRDIKKFEADHPAHPGGERE